MQQMAMRTVDVADEAMEQDQQDQAPNQEESLRKKALDKYHVVRLEEYVTTMEAKKQEKQAAHNKLWAEHDKAFEDVNSLMKSVEEYEKELQQWDRASSETEKIFQELISECYTDETHFGIGINLPSLYKQQLKKELTLNPEADLQTITLKCDSEIKVTVLAEGSEYRQECDKNKNKEYNEAYEAHLHKYKTLRKEAGEEDMRLTRLIVNEKDEEKRKKYNRELDDHRTQTQQLTTKMEKQWHVQRMSLLKEREDECNEINEVIKRLDRLTSNLGPFLQDSNKDKNLLSAKANFIEAFYSARQLEQELANEKNHLEEAHSKYNLIQPKKQKDVKIDTNDLQFTVMLRQIQAHSEQEDAKQVVASVKNEIKETITKLTEEKERLLTKHKEDTKELKRSQKSSMMRSKKEVDALQKRLKTMDKELTDVEVKLASANVLRQNLYAAQQKKLVEGIAKTRQQIEDIENNSAEQKEKLKKELKLLQEEHKESLHKLKNDLDYWDESMQELKDYEDPDDPSVEGEVDEARLNESMDKLNDSMHSLDLEDPDDPLGEISHLGNLTFNEPALQYNVRFTAADLKEVVTLMEQGNKLKSSLKKKNQLLVGNVHYYCECNSVEELYNVDNEPWFDVRHQKVKEAIGLNTGPGIRRQWSYGTPKDCNKQIQRMAYFYPKAKLGIVRYHSKVDPDEIDEKWRPTPKAQNHPSSTQEAMDVDVDDNVGANMDVDVDPLQSLKRKDEPAIEGEDTFRATLAVPILSEKHLLLDAETLHGILTDSESQLLDPLSTYIQDPKSGQLYIFKVGEDSEVAERCIRSDGYSWKYKKTENQNDIFLRTLYYTRKEGGSGGNVSAKFTRYVYTSIKGKQMAVHYMGDETAGVKLKQRYSEPQTLYRIKQAADKLRGKKISPLDMYNKLKSSTTSEGVAKERIDPTNVAAVKWLLNTMNAESAIARDDVQNVMTTVRYTETAYIRNVECVPNLRALLCDSRALDEINTMLKHTPNDQTIELHYDTTFNVQDKYLSILSMRHTYISLKDAPVYRNPGAIIPLMSNLHQTRGDYDHKLFFFHARETIRRHCPNFLDRKKVLITDGEFEGVADDWPNTEQVLCWNHQRQNIHWHAENRLSRKMNVDDVKSVNADVFRFLAHTTQAGYEHDRDNTFQTAPHWNTPLGQELKAYFLKHKDRSFQKYSCRYALEAKGLTNVETGITNNAAETLNSRLTFLKDKDKIATVDGVFLQLQKYERVLNNEIHQAYYGVGRYALDEDHLHLLKDKNNLPSTFVTEPEEIQQNMRELAAMRPTIHVEGPAPAEIHERGRSQSRPFSSVQEHAKFYVDEQMVSLIKGTAGVNQWLVEAPGQSYVVQLANNICSCGSRSFCAHILACRVTAGLQADYSLPRGKTLSAVSRARSLPTPGRRQPVYGGKRPNRAVLINEAVNPPEAHRTTVTFADATPTLHQYTPQNVRDQLESPTPSKRGRGRPRASDLRTQVLSRNNTFTDDSSDMRDLADDLDVGGATPTINRYSRQSIEEQIELVTGPTLSSNTATGVPQPTPTSRTARGRPRSSNVRNQLFGEAFSFAQRSDEEEEGEVLAVPTPAAIPSAVASGPHPSLVATSIQRAGSRLSLAAQPVRQPSVAQTLRQVDVTCNVLENQLQRGDIVTVLSKDGSGVVVRHGKEGHLIICMDSEKTKEDWDLLETCTGMACTSAIKSSRNRYRFELKVAMRCEAGRSKESLAQSTGNDRDLEYQTVPMTCSCGKAAFEGSPNSMKCSGCSRTFHKDCPGFFSDTSCKACGLPFTGMIWSQTREYSNTCPGDTVMTPMVDHCLYDDQLLLHSAMNYKKMNSADKDFAAACVKASMDTSTENLGEAHDMFMSRVAQIAKNSSKKDCFMSINEIHHSMCAMNTFIKKKTCNGLPDQPCKSKHAPVEFQTILLPASTPEESTAAVMREVVYGVKPIEIGQGACGGCKRRKSPTDDDPLVMEGPLSIRDNASPPPCLIFETTGSTALEEAFRAPEELTVSGFTYKKKYIAINRSNAHYICHFKRNDLWLTYDGMQAHRYHVTTPAEKKQRDSNEVVEQIVYYRSTHPATPKPSETGKHRKKN